MNRPTFFCLSALNLFFIGILVVEVYVTTQPMDAAAPWAMKKNASTPEQAQEDLDLSNPSEESYSDLVERPMFIKGRKPVEEPIPEEVVLASAQKLDNVNWELIGIYRTPKGTTAFFSRSPARLPKDNFRKCKLGDALDGWQLSEINDSGVNLTLGDQTKNLPLRKMKPKSAAPSSVTQTNTTQTTTPQNVDASTLTVQPTAATQSQATSPEPEDPANP